MPLGPEEITHRFGYHPGTSFTIPRHKQVREAYDAFAKFLDMILPDGRAKSTAFTNLQQSSMWANFAIAELAPVVDENAPTKVSSAVAPTTGGCTMAPETEQPVAAALDDYHNKP